MLKVNSWLVVKIISLYNNVIKEIDKITHKLFPSKKIVFGKYSYGELSPLLIKELNKEIKEKNVLIHLHGAHKDLINNIQYNVNLRNTPTVVQQRGGFHPYFKF